MARVLRVLNVAEKPSVAKTVAGILSGGSARTREGRSPYNKIFEFNYSIGSQACFMLMTSVTGHLMELEFEDQYRKWFSCDPADLYSAPVRKHVPQDKQALQRTLEEEARRCQWLVLWLDCDREGENIAFEVIEVCRSTNQHLNIWRAQFSALTERDIFHAVQNLARPNSLFSDAVDARQAGLPSQESLNNYSAWCMSFLNYLQEIDLRIGASFTRMQTLLLSDAFIFPFAEDEKRLVLSYGPCQVYEVIGKERRKFPPHPLNTVELQKRASRYFRMGSEHTMKVAEELYQSGFISYPRTETDFFSENTNLQALVHEQVHHPVWGSYAQRLLDPQQNLWRNPSNGGHDDKAHPPIHPTKFSQNEPGWSADHARIYELVTRHFLACVSQPAVGYGTTVSIDIAGELFSATGLMITARNYLDVYRFDSWGDSILPTFDVGQQFIPTNLSLDMGTTKPPPLLSEADLISLMDQSGIGTDATMHDHIKKLLDRWYATKDAQTRFSPTKLGEALVMGYDSIGYELWKPYLRSTMERDMRAVSDGTKMKAQVLAECLQQMKDCFLDAKQHKRKLMEAMELFFERSNRTNAEQRQVGEVVRLCPSCKEGNMVLKTRPDGGYMVGCLKYPLCRNVVWLPSATMEANVTTMTCSTCGPGAVFKIQFKFKRLEIPPQFSSDYTGCVGGCDQVLSEIIEMCGSGPRGTTAGGQSGAARQAPTGGRGAPSIGGQRQQQLRGRGGGRSLHQQGGRSTTPPPLTGNQQRGGRSARQQGGRSAPVPPATERLVCLCEEVCVLLTANTENNRGRKFYRCPNRKCDFFMWETASEVDSNVSEQIPQARGSNARSARPSNDQSSSNVGRNKKRGESSATTFVRATGETVASGACFVCGDPSHWANACPNRTS